MTLTLTNEELEMLAGKSGQAVMKAMQILVALGTIYHAERLIPVSSVQIAGVSYDNLGDAGLDFLEEMAQDGKQVRVLATLNPAGMDIQNWKGLGIDADFAEKQIRVLRAYERMGVITTCTCTPYLAGNLPHYQEHIAWAESSAVCYANSVIGARTNREGGPSALAAALTGKTAEYGYHLDIHRKPSITIKVQSLPNRGPALQATDWFGVIGKVIGEKLEACSYHSIPYIQGIESASVEELKSFSASLATFGGSALFYMEGITPTCQMQELPNESFSITREDIDSAYHSLYQAKPSDVDFINLGCPHLSIDELRKIASLLIGKKVQKEFWLTTSRPAKNIADMMGYTAIIENSGAKLVADTCCVVAPIKDRFRAMATDSAKACFYGYAKNGIAVSLCSFASAVRLATGDLEQEQLV
jgi:predicted aconitase